MTIRSVAGLAVALLLFTALLAQPAKPPADQGKKDSKDTTPEAPKPPPAFKDGRLDDENDKLTTQDQNDLRKLLFGAADAPMGERRKAVMEKACRWYIYRLTSPEVQGGREGSSSQIMEEILGGPNNIPLGRLYFVISKQSNPDQEELARRKRQWDTVQQFRPIVIAHVEKVLELNALIARVNVMRILHRLAELSYDRTSNEEVVDVYIKVIDNPHEHDAVRLWAFHGLGSLLALQNNPNTAENVKVKDPKRMDRALLATCKWLDARTKMDPAVVSQMADEEKNAISYVRRAAVRALGASRRPFVREEKDVREGPIAQLLARLLNVEEAQLPSPLQTWMEGVEAVYALCQLQSKSSPSYQPEFVAHHMARYVAALGSEANDDTQRERERWKFFGFQMRMGLGNLKDEVPAEKGGAYVKTAAAQIDAVIKNLMDNTENKQAAQELFNWAKDNAPKAKTIYHPPLQ